MSDNELYGEIEPSLARNRQSLHGNDVKRLLETLLDSRSLDAATIQFELQPSSSDSSQRRDVRPEHSIADLQANVKALTKKIRALEARTAMYGSLIEELEFKLNLAPHEEKIDEILNCARKMFKDLDFVTGLHYIPLEDGTLRMIIIHDLDDRVKALELTQEKQMDIERAFESTSFQMLLLHESEVRSDHLLGAIQVISKLG